MRLELSPETEARLKGHLRAAGRREIGGVLMAEQLGVDHFRIIDFSVDDQTGGVAHFVRSPEHHQQALDAFFAKTSAAYKRYNYLGEWHSHPSYPVRPSLQDRVSMQSLVEGERGISFAVLMIFRLHYWLWLEYSATLFQRDLTPRG